MRWMITDSGLGGLSVCAGLEKLLRETQKGYGIELLYVNATPHDHAGYNALATQVERIALFDKFLWSTNAHFSPDEIVIACNTLSVIYEQTRFAGKTSVKVRGIVETGVALCDQNLALTDEKNLIVFATETTTEASTYPQNIRKDASIVAQACPGLAHAISNDSSGAASRKLLDRYIEDALAKFDQRPKSVFAFLGCTHYGYQMDIFKALFEERGIAAKILNPNDLLIHQLQSGLVQSTAESSPELRVRFVSRYQIPQVEIDSMVAYLGKSAPLTLAALQNHEVLPDLFDLK